MGEVLIVFGSKSDALVYEKLAQALKEKEISFELRVCSAHRTPEELKKILAESKAKVIVAGAGLSAALPGVMASHTVRPVIGIPVSGNYQGLDALLSVMQMPPGIPVLAVSVDGVEQAAENLEQILKKKNYVTLVKKEVKAFQKAKDLLGEFNVSFGVEEEVKDYNEETIYLEFVPLNELNKIKAVSALRIFIPLKENSLAEDALKLQQAKQGLWVGLNRGENAALAAIEILSLGNPFKEALEAYRKKLKEKVLTANEAEKKKVYGRINLGV